MNSEDKVPDEPILDTSSKYQNNPPALADIQEHRNQPSNAPTISIGSLMNEDPGTSDSEAANYAASATILHARRKQSQRKNQSPSSTPGVMFQLGEQGEPVEESHTLFCELDELCDPEGNGKFEWRETARWIKFEEDVEENGERWSKPHVATVSLLSLFQVRSCLDKAIFMFGLDANNIEQISDLVLNKFVSEGMLPPESVGITRDLLLKRHLHLHNRMHGKFHGRSATNLPLIRSLADIGKKYSSKEVDKETHLTNNKSSGTLGDELVPPGTYDQQGETSQGRFDLHFMKKIPPGAETSNILVGETEFLEQPICAFLRLKEAVILGEMTEVPVPTRFIFIFLQPKNQSVLSKEIGRSMATLMSDEIFHDVAYKARRKEDILIGLDEFLSSATVLPPGEWDPNIRIEPPTSIPSQEGRKLQSNGASQDKLLNQQTTQISEHLTGVKSNHALNGKNDKGGGSGPPEDGPGSNNADEPNEPPDPNEGALDRTGKFCGGLILDVKRRLPHFKTDITDAIHPQSIGSLFFLYFACLAPIITFGGLLAQETGGYLGTMESILSGAVVGMTYAIFSGQPLTILGSTGPVLVFEKILYKICKANKWYYLSFRLWVGAWTFVFLLIMVAFDLSFLVKFITRFTEESFATLIAVIFIYSAIDKLLDITKNYPLNFLWQPSDTMKGTQCSCVANETLSVDSIRKDLMEKGNSMDIPMINGTDKIDWALISQKRFSWQGSKYIKICTQLSGTWQGSENCKDFFAPDIFLFSCLIFIASFVISYKLKAIKTSPFFPARVRSIISDFAVMIAIVGCTLVDYYFGFHTPKLSVPPSFEPTLGFSKRGWIVYPFNGNPWYTSLVAFGPALLSTILLFMDQQITSVIVNRRENKLKKGAGYHLDLLVMACTMMLNSILGIPWFVAATVLSINHVLSLKKESESNAPGEKPTFLGCREQRVTHFFIFLLIGLSVFMTPFLKFIPMPVLYGIFLFMGMATLNGIQFVDRILLLLMPVKYQPDYPYLRHVPTRRVHLFTVIQVFCFGLLYVIKTISVISILFPLMVLALCFIRKLLDFVFTQHELKWLDDILPGAKLPKRKSYTGFDAAEMKTVPSSEKILSISTEVPKTNIWKNMDNNTERRRNVKSTRDGDDEDCNLIPFKTEPGCPQIKFSLDNDSN